MAYKMICECCKKEKATEIMGTLNVCKKCYIELMNSFHYYIGGKEVTEEEYKRRIN